MRRMYAWMLLCRAGGGGGGGLGGLLPSDGKPLDGPFLAFGRTTWEGCQLPWDCPSPLSQV